MINRSPMSVFELNPQWLLVQGWPMAFFDSYKSVYSPEAEAASRKYFMYFLIGSGMYPSYKNKFNIISELVFRVFIWALIVTTDLLIIQGLYDFLGTPVFFTYLHVLCVSLLIPTVTVLVRVKRPHMTAVLEYINKRVYNYNEECMGKKYEEEYKTVNKHCQMLRRVMLVIMYGGVGSMLAVGPVLNLIFSLPPLYHDLEKRGVNIYLPIPAMSPFDENFKGGFYILLFLEYSGATLVTFYIDSISFFFTNTLLHVFGTLRLMKWGLDNIELRASEMLEQIKKNEGNATFEECYLICFRRSIAHYIEIRKFYQELNSLMHDSLLLGFYGIAIVFGVSGYQALEMSSDSIGNWLSSMLMGVAEYINIFLYCFFAEHATSLHDEVQVSIYSLLWYERSSLLKRDLLVILAASLDDFAITSSLGIVINRDMYATMLNTAYTYINLLHAIK